MRDLYKAIALVEVSIKAAQELRAEGDEQAAKLADEGRQQATEQAERVRKETNQPRLRDR